MEILIFAEGIYFDRSRFVGAQVRQGVSGDPDAKVTTLVAVTLQWNIRYEAPLQDITPAGRQWLEGMGIELPNIDD